MPHPEDKCFLLSFRWSVLVLGPLPELKCYIKWNRQYGSAPTASVRLSTLQWRKLDHW